MKVVSVDVSVIGSGDKPVTGLTTADFEVEEDGVRQKVDTAQFIRLDGQPKADGETSLEIRSREHSRAQAAREDVRLFVIFLDDYHIDRGPTITIPLRRALLTFISKLQPTDIAAIVDPITPNNTITFTRSQADLSDIIRNFEGRQGEIFPIKNKAEEAQLKSGDVSRLRAQVTLSALTSLCYYLGGLREGRKTIIFVSQGPPLIFGSGTAEYRTARCHRRGEPRQRDDQRRGSARPGFRDPRHRLDVSPGRRDRRPRRSSTRTISKSASGKSCPTRARTICSATRRRAPRTTGSTTRSR